jgi:hypothetical protein
MNRNSSFFWASDALRDTEEEEVEEHFVEDVGPSWDNEDEVTMTFTEKSSTIAIRDEEAQPLVENSVPSYGNSTVARENVTLGRVRQDDEYLFPHREMRRDPSKSPQTIRLNDAENTVLRFQVV